MLLTIHISPQEFQNPHYSSSLVMCVGNQWLEFANTEE
jgi:hypothetical protein